MCVFFLPRERNFMQVAPTRMSILPSISGAQAFWMDQRGWFGKLFSEVGLLSKQGVGITIKKIWRARSFSPLCMNLISVEKDDFYFLYSSRKFNPTTTSGESKLQSHFSSLSPGFPLLAFSEEVSTIRKKKHISSMKAVMVAIPY